MDMNSFVRAQWDRVLAVTLVILGGIALLLGWLGVSGTALSYRQLPYVISGGLFGVALIGIGLTLYLSADLRDEWRKLDALEEALAAVTPRLGLVEETVAANGARAARTRAAQPRARSAEATAR